MDLSPLGKSLWYTPGVRVERRDAAEHRQQVLAAAARLFGERGVEAVTMDEIAQAASVGKGTLYRRYADKGQLVLALMDACVQRLQDQVAAQLESVLARMVDWVEEHVTWLGVLSDQAAGPRRGAVHCSRLYGWMHAVVLELLQRAVATGEAAIDDCVYTADAILALLDIDLYVFQRRERGYSPQQILAGMGRLVRGLRRRTLTQ